MESALYEEEKDGVEAMEDENESGQSSDSASSIALANRLMRRIFDGAYPVGSKLPPVREMAEEFGVNRLVVREALKRLEALGIVRIHRGSGTYADDVEITGGLKDENGPGQSSVSTLSIGLANKLMRRIVDGAYPAGSKLPPEREMADEFGVNRLVVREALKRIEAMGIVRIRHGSGTYIEDVELKGGVELSDMFLYDEEGGVNLAFLSDIVDFHEFITIHAIRLAAPRITGEELGKLKTLVKERAETANDHQRRVALTIEITRTLVDACRNKYIHLHFNTVLRVTRGFQMVFGAPGVLDSGMQIFFENLLEALEHRDQEMAVLLTTRIFKESRDFLEI